MSPADYQYDQTERVSIPESGDSGKGINRNCNFYNNN